MKQYDYAKSEFLQMFGYKIIESDLGTKYEKKIQYRFPRSKKTRIRKKWSKQDRNYKMKEMERIIKVNDMLIASKEMVEKIKNIGVKYEK